MQPELQDQNASLLLSGLSVVHAFEGSQGVALPEKLVKVSILGFASTRSHHRRCEALCETEKRKIGQTG